MTYQFGKLSQLRNKSMTLTNYKLSHVDPLLKSSNKLKNK